LQDLRAEPYSAQHFEHGLPTLFREGGNVPALWTRSRGQATRLIGLTWIDERQAIMVRPGSGISGAAALKGRRLAVPDRRPSTVDFFRAMALHGFAGALHSAGLDLADAVLVDVAQGELPASTAPSRGDGWQPELAALIDGVVDAVYVKGAAAVEAARAVGAETAVELDAIGDRRLRVNNGTPRPITVHQALLDERPDLVARFLAVLLETARWSAGHLEDLQRILQVETGAGLHGVSEAYRGSFHLSLQPDLSAERLELLTQQKDFLLVHGFLEGDVDVARWAAHEPLEQARALAGKASSRQA
jgi:ABC-type nitrate/sulfonate/bicarbonate transport system substrate-binding protein